MATGCVSLAINWQGSAQCWQTGRLLVSTKAADPRLVKPPSEAENTFLLLFNASAKDLLLSLFVVYEHVQRFQGLVWPLNLQNNNPNPSLLPWTAGANSLNGSIILHSPCWLCGCPAPWTLLLTPHFPSFQQPFLCLLIIYTSVQMFDALPHVILPLI